MVLSNHSLNPNLDMGMHMKCPFALLNLHTAALGYFTDCIHISLSKEWLKSQKTVKKYRSYLLLHHHLQRLSPEKNTTECHFLHQLLKKWKQFNKNKPPQSSSASTQWFQIAHFRACARPLPQQCWGTITHHPPHLFPLDIVFVSLQCSVCQKQGSKSSVKASLTQSSLD